MRDSPLSPPATSSAYADDDATTDRVSLAFADLHGTLRDLGDGNGHWKPAYYRLADGNWAGLRDALDRQATTAGWQHDPRVSEQATGYLRRAWRDGNRLTAAALVAPPADSDGATVLVLLQPTP